MWKFHKKKKWLISFFISLFVKGAFNMRVYEIGIIEGAIALVLLCYKAHINL